MPVVSMCSWQVVSRVFWGVFSSTAWIFCGFCVGFMAIIVSAQNFNTLVATGAMLAVVSLKTLCTWLVVITGIFWVFAVCARIAICLFSSRLRLNVFLGDSAMSARYSEVTVSMITRPQFFAVYSGRWSITAVCSRKLVGLMRIMSSAISSNFPNAIWESLLEEKVLSQSMNRVL